LIDAGLKVDSLKNQGISVSNLNNKVFSIKTRKKTGKDLKRFFPV
jgi:hypothetical protein